MYIYSVPQRWWRDIYLAWQFSVGASFQTGGLCCAIYNVFGLSFADLNGDGKVDVLSQSNSS